METKKGFKINLKKSYYFITSLTLLMFIAGVAAGSSGGIQHYKLVSSLEYAGPGQFRNQTEQLITIEKKSLSDAKVGYVVSAGDMFNDLSFVVDRDKQQLLQVSNSAAFWAQINNHCVKSLKKTNGDDIQKTWKQSFDLSSVQNSLPANLNFTLTAMQVDNQGVGKMIAVRALSEPFFVPLSAGTATSRINSVYLFDSAIEEIYLNVSIFESITTFNGFKEVLQHKVAICKSNADGQPVDLKGFGKEFESFVSKVNLTKGFKVTRPCALPEWAKTESLPSIQAAGICSSLACEGALNPVTSISMPVTRILENQMAADEGTPGQREWWDVWGQLVDWVGPWPAAGIVATAITVPIATSGGGGGSSGAASP